MIDAALHTVRIQRPTVSTNMPSFSTPTSPCSSSSPSLLLRLPPVLLPQVCSNLSFIGLLVALARTGKTVRDALTVACFTPLHLDLDTDKMWLLSKQPPSPLTLSFHSRVLTDLQVSVHLSCPHMDMQQVLASLEYFPSCRILNVHNERHEHVCDAELYALLQHPTSLHCESIGLHHFSLEPVEHMCSHVLHRPIKRERSVDIASSEQRPYTWAHIRLPSLSRLRLSLEGSKAHAGSAAFLAAHPALHALETQDFIRLTCLADWAVPRPCRTAAHESSHTGKLAEQRERSGSDRHADSTGDSGSDSGW